MIQIKNLQKTYAKKDKLEPFFLNIEELFIQRNEIVYFVGPNGSGKSTLLSLIQGQATPDKGSVFINSENQLKNIDLIKLKPFERAKFLGVVPQDSDESLVNEMNIIEHVIVSLYLSDKLPWLFPGRKLIDISKTILSKFGMGFEHRLYEFVGNLSGGERQILSFCLATVRKPVVLLLDEFTAALDPQMSLNVLKLVVNHIKSNKLSALIVTHRHKEAIDNADRIIILHKGRPYKEITRGGPEFNEIELKKIYNQLYLNHLESR